MKIIPHIDAPHENFIRSYDDVLPEAIFDDLFDIIDNRPYWTERSVPHNRKDAQIVLDESYSHLCKTITAHLMEKCVDKYAREFSGLLLPDSSIVSGATCLQKTNFGEGYHQWHCEKIGLYSDRDIAWMIYLNNVLSGGETEWLHQSVRIQPRKNVAVLWPGGWTHLHRGTPPLSEAKYILTGWLSLTPNKAGYKSVPLSINS